jgi:hypothetical protein
MGNAPPPDFPPPAAGGPSLAFPPSPAASLCGFSLGLPKFSFGFKLPSSSALSFPPAIPLPFVAFKLSCDPKKPVDVTAGLKLPFGGGRPNNMPADPDDNEAYP